jgi:hypothetical protein
MHQGVWGDMIGCLLLFPLAGFLVLMGVYMSTLMGYFVAVATAMGIYMSGMAAYFTAFFFIVFG